MNFDFSKFEIQMSGRYVIGRRVGASPSSVEVSIPTELALSSYLHFFSTLLFTKAAGFCKNFLSNCRFNIRFQIEEE